MNTPDWEGLRAFRYHVYTLFGCRRDALLEALDAVLTAPMLETLVALYPLDPTATWYAVDASVWPR